MDSGHTHAHMYLSNYINDDPIIIIIINELISIYGWTSMATDKNAMEPHTTKKLIQKYNSHYVNSRS